MPTKQEEMSPARLPPELLLYMVSFIDDLSTLKTCCLAAQVFVELAQSRLFSRLDLTNGMASETIQSVTSSPHLTRHIRSIIASYDHISLPTVLEALPDPQDVAQGTTLNSLTLFYDETQRLWTTSLLRPLHVKVLPFLVSLTLDTIVGPLAIVTACRALQNLRVYTSVLFLETQEEFEGLFPSEQEENVKNSELPAHSQRRWEPVKQISRFMRSFKLRGGPASADSSSELTKIEEVPWDSRHVVPSTVESASMEFVTTLAIDGTQNPNGSLCPLIILIQTGGFPAVKSLDMRRLDSRWFPQPHMSNVLKPLMNQLTCLDMGLWSQWDSLMHDKEYLDLFRIGHYPLLCSYSVDLSYSRESSESDARAIAWLVDSFERLGSHHPLEVFTLRLGKDGGESDISGDGDVYYETGGSIRGLEEGWYKLDPALAENPHLEKLAMVLIPVRRELVALRRLLVRSLPRVSGTGKLTFESVNTERYL
ncbi:hypothetical protein DL96DRAFT_1623241 [Flagelloscypha sp. PMI_526]|nr:hypothetical protein DL96DRAFT_1623241 [Flagelloscypha sp. PMI_526]